MRIRISCFLALLSLVQIVRADDYFPPPDTQGGWRTTTTPEEVKEKAGLDLKQLQDAFAITERTSQNGGLLIVRHGYFCFEKYFGRAHRDGYPDMASTGKAYTSIAVGIMLQEFHDKIPEGLNTKVFTKEFLPEAFPLDDPRKADITLGQLLCMTGGYNGEGGAPVGVVHGKTVHMKPMPGQDIHNLDQSSIHAALWTDPGAGYSYSSPEPHIASIVLRHIVGMDLKDFIDQKLAKPQGWGPWGYCIHRGDFTQPVSNGAGSISVHATDALRFAYCLLHQGKWKDQQLVPADYVALCNKPSPFNPHCPFTLMFEQNSDGHAIGVPRDAYFKSGAGGFCLYVVPSLDMVVYKLGGHDGQYDPKLTGLPDPFQYDGSRTNWQPVQGAPFVDPSMLGEDGLRRILQMVCAAARD
jgi:CubicO group peptidase (beta-lactamase class C family)